MRLGGDYTEILSNGVNQDKFLKGILSRLLGGDYTYSLYS